MKTRFKVEPILESFGNKYVKTIDKNATLQGARFMDGKKDECRLWYLIPATKTEKEKWNCALVLFTRE